MAPPQNFFAADSIYPPPNTGPCARDVYVASARHQPAPTQNGNEQRKLFWQTVLDCGDDLNKNFKPSDHQSSSVQSSSSGAQSSSNKRKNFHCTTCRTGYVQKGDYMRHIRTRHQGIRPYPCTTCGESFSRRSILNKHLKTHTKPRKGVSKPSMSN